MTQFNADIDIERLEAQTYAYRLDLIDNDNDVKLQLRRRLQHQLQESRPRVKILKHNFFQNIICPEESPSEQTDQQDLCELVVRQMELFDDSSGFDDTSVQNLTDRNDINLEVGNSSSQSAPSIPSSAEVDRNLVLRKSTRTRKKVRRYDDDFCTEVRCRNTILPNDYCVSTTGIDGTLTINIRISPRHSQKYVKKLTVDVGQELNPSRRSLANAIQKLGITETHDHDILRDDATLSQLYDLIEPNDLETRHAANELNKINNNVSDNYNTFVSVTSEPTSITSKRRYTNSHPSTPKGPQKKRCRKAKNDGETSTQLKSDLAKYIDLFTDDCEMPSDSLAESSFSNMSQQLVTSTTQHWDDAIVAAQYDTNWIDSEPMSNDNLIAGTVQITENDCTMASQFDDFVNYIDSSNNDVGGNNVIARVLDGGSNAQLPMAGWHNGQYTTHQISGQPLECQSIIRLPDNTIVANIQMPAPPLITTLEPLPLDAPPQAHNCSTSVLDLSIKSNRSAEILIQSPGEAESTTIDDTPIDLTVKKTKQSADKTKQFTGDDESDDNFIRRLIETTGYDFKSGEGHNTANEPGQTSEVAPDMPLLDVEDEMETTMLDAGNEEAAQNYVPLNDSNNNETGSVLTQTCSTPNSSLVAPRRHTTDLRSIATTPVEKVLSMIFSETNDQDALNSCGSEIATVSPVNCDIQEALKNCGIDVENVTKIENSDGSIVKEEEPTAVEIKEEDDDDLELQLKSFTLSRHSVSVKEGNREIKRGNDANGRTAKPMVNILSVEILGSWSKDADNAYIQRTLNKAAPPALVNCKSDESPKSADNHTLIAESIKDDVCENVESNIFEDASASDETNTNDLKKAARQADIVLEDIPFDGEPNKRVENNVVCEKVDNIEETFCAEPLVIEKPNTDKTQKTVENDEMFDVVESLREIILVEPLPNKHPNVVQDTDSTGKEENIVKAKEESLRNTEVINIECEAEEELKSVAKSVLHDEPNVENIKSELDISLKEEPLNLCTEVVEKEDNALDLPKLTVLKKNSQELIDIIEELENAEDNVASDLTYEMPVALNDENTVDSSNDKESGTPTDSGKSKGTAEIEVVADAHLTKAPVNDALECTLDDMDLELDYEYDDAISLATSYFDSGDENDLGDSNGATEKKKPNSTTTTQGAQDSSEPKNELSKNTIVSAETSAKSDTKTNLRSIKKFVIPKLSANNNNKNVLSTATGATTKPPTPIATPSSELKFIGLEKIKRTVQNICAVPAPPRGAVTSAAGAAISVVPSRILFPTPTNAIADHVMDVGDNVNECPAVSHVSLNRGEFMCRSGLGLNRGLGPLEVSQLFGITCIAFLSDKCFTFTACQLSHHLREPCQVKVALEALNKSNINVAYRFSNNYTKIFRRYFSVFCEVYASQNNRTKLLNMVYDCERHIDGAQFVVTIYHSLVQCGLSKVNACRKILRVSRFQMACYDVLLHIIMETDCVMFRDYIERIAAVPQYKFPFNVLNQMASTLLRSKNLCLTPLFWKCVNHLNPDDHILVPNSYVMEMLQLIKSGDLS